MALIASSDADSKLLSWCFDNGDLLRGNIRQDVMNDFNTVIKQYYLSQVSCPVTLAGQLESNQAVNHLDPA